jgi:hypothetical protein
VHAASSAGLVALAAMVHEEHVSFELPVTTTFSKTMPAIGLSGMPLHSKNDRLVLTWTSRIVIPRSTGVALAFVGGTPER